MAIRDLLPELAPANTSELPSRPQRVRDLTQSVLAGIAGFTSTPADRFVDIGDGFRAVTPDFGSPAAATFGEIGRQRQRDQERLSGLAEERGRNIRALLTQLGAQNRQTRRQDFTRKENRTKAKAVEDRFKRRMQARADADKAATLEDLKEAQAVLQVHEIDTSEMTPEQQMARALQISAQQDKLEAESNLATKKLMRDLRETQLSQAKAQTDPELVSFQNYVAQLNRDPDGIPAKLSRGQREAINTLVQDLKSRGLSEAEIKIELQKEFAPNTLLSPDEAMKQLFQQMLDRRLKETR